MNRTALLLAFWALPWSAFSQEFTLEKLPPFINSAYNEISPVPSRDGQTLYFTRVGYIDYDHTLLMDSVDMATHLPADMYYNTLADVYSQIAGRRISNPDRSDYNQDVWVAVGDSTGFKKIQHPGYPLNNALPNSIVSITPDPNAFYIINQFERGGNMNRGFSVIRRKSDGNWDFPVPVEIKDFYTITSEVNLTMSFDGQILILSATREDAHDMDLYVCFREGNNKWSAPQHLGNVLNSDKRETTPFLSEDNQTLYFASNRNSWNGSEIFMSTRLDDSWTQWSTPEVLRRPINTSYDEAQPYFNMSSGYIYFISNRHGNSDIYRVQIAPPQPTEIVVQGRILNSKTGELVRNSQVRYGAETFSWNTISSSDGTFTLKIPKGIQFELTPEKGGFTGKVDHILLRRDYYYFREQLIDLYLDPLEINARIELRPIYFQQSKDVILEKSFPELERLAGILIENPGLHIRVEGHTDNVGDPGDLLLLSEKRAMAIRNFLIEKGIDPERIESIGYGSNKPINDNSNDELRQENRRVEVRITKT